MKSTPAGDVSLEYDGNGPTTPQSAVRQEAWDIRQSGSEGDFDLAGGTLEELLAKDLAAALSRGDASWRGWSITHPKGIP